MKAKKNQIGSKVILIAFILLSYSCATIVSKSKYPLAINSNPNGAKVIITNKKGNEIFNGTTPATISLKAGAGFFTPAKYSLKFEMDGYDTKTIPVKMTFDGWYIGNLLFGGLIGILIVDPATGAMWRLDITQINASLDSKSAFQPDSSLQIYSITDIPSDWKDKLIPLE